MGCDPSAGKCSCMLFLLLIYADRLRLALFLAALERKACSRVSGSRTWCCCKQGMRAELAQVLDALPVCIISTSGFCCKVPGLTGEESDCEERWDGRAGKGNEVLSFNVQNLLQ